MARVLVYSHDTFGLGNIRRMLAVATQLACALEDTSVLVVSGSPMLQGFRLAPQIDYIKLPSVTRTLRDGYSTRTLRVDAPDLFELRANLILAAVADFRPDVLLVDKKPFGIEHELEGAIYYAKSRLPDTSLVLVLRDILDHPDATIASWRRGGYTAAIERFYERVLVLGSREVFDVCREYALPPSVRAKLRYCGYIRRPRSAAQVHETRAALGVGDDERLVLVTPGGGQDGAGILRAYADALPILHRRRRLRSLIVTGPELAPSERQAVQASAAEGVEVREFTDDMMRYMDAADVVVCMGGYNTMCEVASLGKRAVVVPRVRPVEEQWIRATRLSRLGIVTAVHPDGLDGPRLAATVLEALDTPRAAPRVALDLGALPRVAGHVRGLLRRPPVTDLLSTRARIA